MKNFVITVRHTNFEEEWATASNYKTAVKFAIEAILANNGKVVKIK